LPALHRPMMLLNGRDPKLISVAQRWDYTPLNFVGTMMGCLLGHPADSPQKLVRQ
jgi:hypothetical protein